jgi:hypothetical protein
MSNSYFERNYASVSGWGVDIMFNTNINGCSMTSCFSRSTSQRVYPVSFANQLLDPSVFTPKENIVVSCNDGIDVLTCYSTANEKCRSISFSCLASISSSSTINIKAESGNFYEGSIKSISDGKTLNIIGNGKDATFIYSCLSNPSRFIEDDAITYGSQNSLFISYGSNSLSVKDLSIFFSYINKNVFSISSSGSFNIENVIVKPLSLFTITKTIYENCIVYLSGTGSYSFSSFFIYNIYFLNSNIFFNSNGVFPNSFLLENCVFNNISRTGSGDGSVISSDISTEKSITITSCEFIYCSTTDASGNGGAIYVLFKF